MKVRFWLFLVAMSCIHATVRAETSIPYGYEKVLSAGRVDIYSQGRRGLNVTQQSEIQKVLKVVSERYTKLYGLDREILRVGVNGGLFRKVATENASLVVFPSLEDLQDWVGDKNVAGITIHISRSDRLVGVALTDGGISPETWHVVWHEFSHVFFSHYLALGRPMWLNEGIAEYFGYENPQNAKQQSETFKTMLESLQRRRAAGEETPVNELLTMRQKDFTRQHYDEAWVLVHLLMTECTSQLNALMSVLSALESNAWANADGVEHDLCNLARTLLEKSFGGEEALQKAWDDHLAAVLANPDAPEKLTARPKPIDTATWAPSIDARLSGSAKTVLVDGDEYKARHPRGTVIYRAPFNGEVQVTMTIGFQDGTWSSSEWILVEERTMRPGEKVEFKEELIPDYEKGKMARLSVHWSLEDGGTYRTTKEWNYK